jgi:hypothetical protein
MDIRKYSRVTPMECWHLKRELQHAQGRSQGQIIGREPGRRDNAAVPLAHGISLIKVKRVKEIHGFRQAAYPFSRKWWTEIDIFLPVPRLPGNQRIPDVFTF